MHIYINTVTISLNIKYMIETRKKRFKRIAIKRVNKALNQLRILGNLANRSYYDYSDEDINRMFRALDTELKAAKGKFHVGPKRFRL